MLLLSILPFMYGLVVATAKTLPTISQYLRLDQTSISTTNPTEKIPGHNNATFCRVPRAKQLFEVEFLEIAPDPVPVNQIFFIYLRGTAPTSANALANATLRVTTEAVLDAGGSRGPKIFEIPLKTTAYGDDSHLSIRNATGAYSESLTAGRNDILADLWIPGMFIDAGWWTFEVEGVLESGGCLFCFGVRQRLEHKNM